MHNTCRKFSETGSSYTNPILFQDFDDVDIFSTCVFLVKVLRPKGHFVRRGRFILVNHVDDKVQVQKIKGWSLVIKLCGDVKNQVQKIKDWSLVIKLCGARNYADDTSQSRWTKSSTKNKRLISRDKMRCAKLCGIHELRKNIVLCSMRDSNPQPQD